MKASATLERRTDKEGARRGEERRRRDGWTWLGGVFLVPGFRLLGREARGSFCSPRRRIRRPTLSPPTRSNSLPPASAALPPFHPRIPCRFYPSSSNALYPAATPVAPRFSTPTLSLFSLPLLLPLRQPELWLITYRRSP